MEKVDEEAGIETPVAVTETTPQYRRTSEIRVIVVGDMTINLDTISDELLHELVQVTAIRATLSNYIEIE